MAPVKDWSRYLKNDQTHIYKTLKQKYPTFWLKKGHIRGVKFVPGSIWGKNIFLGNDT